MTSDTTDLYSASPEDIEFFNRVTEGLPKAAPDNTLDSNGEPMPYACGPHSVKCFREIIRLTQAHRVFEIGFNVGFSAAMWIELGCFVGSCEKSTRQESYNAANVLLERYTRGLFEFFGAGSDYIMLHQGYQDTLLKPLKFDMIFIDGDHSEPGVTNDIQLALNLGVKWLAFDDYLPQFGPGVQSAIAKFPQLEMVKIMGNIALYKNTVV